MTYKHLNPLNGIIIANKKGLSLLAVASEIFALVTIYIIVVDFCTWEFPASSIRGIIAFYILSLAANFHYWKDINKTN